MNDKDFDLVKKSLAGDDSAFNELVHKYKKRVYFLTLRLVKNHEIAAELSQETFIKAYYSLKKFKGKSSFYTWLYRIAVNICLNYIKRSHKERYLSIESQKESVFSVDNDVLNTLEQQELNTAIKNAINSLPYKQRLIFILRYYEELPHKEIAKIMHRSEGTIKSNYFQAVKKLKQLLKQYI